MPRKKDSILDDLEATKRTGRSFGLQGIARFPHDRGLASAAQKLKIMEQLNEQQAKETADNKIKGSKRLSDDIIPHILNLYSSPTARDFEIYAPNATFEDPLMCGHGVKQIKSAFYSIPKVFSESKIVEYSVQENAIAPGKGEILIDNKQHYKFLGKDVTMISLIKLQVDEGKVVRHEDWWDKKPLWNRDTVKLPLLGRLVEMSRKGSMLATHAMMGFGKDTNP
ncbi:hypothetical protein BVC80_1289g42 [Macleaya cordata]|uniref:Uncharacterized protein n=1 Tax=Macleaya cordata TaxID=56857 RepID=A0A200Q9J6_MACCD|nr:hypothetical protein BVC80_1289g42 [Macleaya cordata]